MSDQARPLFGALIGVVFGVVFFVANAGAFDSPVSVVVRVVGIAIGVAMFVRVMQLRGRTEVAPQELGYGRNYWLVVGAEVVALLAGVFVCNEVLDHPEASVAWVAVVVGVHFLALARIWRERKFTVLGTVMAALGVLGIVLAVATDSTAAVAAVAGLGSGVALFVAAGSVLGPESVPR